MPTQLRSMEPEDQIEWLGTALSEAHHQLNSLQQNIDNLEAYCDNVTADLEESQRRLSDIEEALQMAVHEKEYLFKNLEISTRDHEEVSERAVQIEVENDKLRNEIKGLQEKVSERAVQFEVENDKLQNEIKGLQEELAEKLKNEEYIHKIEAEIQRLQDLIGDTLQDAGATGMVSGGSSIECLEGLLRKLLEKYSSLSLGTPVQSNAVEEHVVQRTDATPDGPKQRGTLDAEESEIMVIKKDFQGALGDLVHVMEERDSYAENADATLDEPRKRDMLDAEESEVAVLKKELQEVLGDLLNVKEERDSYAEKHQSLAREFEALNRRREELQELLSQEEQKSASAKEKLNVAVRRGKSLVQQRDSLKQTIEELSSKVEELKSEINLREDALAGYEQKIKDLSPYQERVTALESECAFLSNRLTQTEHYLQEKGHSLSIVLNTLGEIDVGTQINTSDPVEKLEKIGKLCRDLDAAVIISEQEARKSKRAAELLLAELNEVQERNDGLQEELVKAGNELVELTRERDMAEVAKHEALSKRENEYAEFMVFRSGLNQLKKDFSDINSFLVDVFSMDLGFLHNLEAGLESCLEPSDASNVVGVPFVSAQGGVASNSEVKENFLSRVFWSGSKTQDHFDDNVEIEVCSFIRLHLQEFTKEVGALKEKLHLHSNSYHEKASSLSNVMGLVHRKMASQKESLESTMRDISSLELIVKEKDTENVVMHRSITLLYEACTDSIMEIENRRAHLVRNNLAAGDLGADLKSADGLIFSGQTLLSSEERVKTMADKLLLTVKEFASIQADIAEGNQLEMKTTIANLHKELQEKDIQKDRICMELVSQIKEADAAAKSYSQELQSTKARVHELEKRVEVLEEERNLLEQRVKDLQDGETASMELKEKVRSMTDVLASKDQEIESLMQSLDEEETQMEELTNKIANLEKIVHQKNVDLENLEASRGKALKKLSITVTKFDELHQLSANLLAEVEKLQSQVQDRDSEISFLRQEVTRCTGDVLVASQMSSKRSSDEIHELLTWLEKMVSQVGAQDVVINDTKSSPRIHENKELLQKQITFIMSELVDLRAVAQSKDALLQVERSRVEELQRKEEALEISLHEKESQLKLLQGAGNSEILEVEPVMNKWASATSVTPQVRSLRKVNNDQVAIAIDDPGTSRLEDEDDDKVHGFKSLTTSRIVPRFTRPVTDMVDGLWVSCDRALMRQPALRLGIMIYWAILHALLAAFVV